MRRLGPALLVLTIAATACAAPLRVSDSAEAPLGLNPHMVFEWKTDALLSHIYDRLLEFDREGNLAPALATSWHRTSPTRLRLRLAEGVRFHNGEPFDADTVVANFQQIRTMGPRHPRQYMFSGIEAVEKISSYEVSLETSTPDNALLHRLAAFSWMVPRSAIDSEGMEALNRIPVGTGPYRFLSHEEDGPLRLGPWAGYWGEEPTFGDGIEFYFLEGLEQVRRLLKGSLDIVGEVDPFHHPSIQEGAGTRLIKGDTLVAVNLVFNTHAEVVSDRGLRKAVAHSILREDLIRYVARGNAVPLLGGAMTGQRLYPGETGLPEFSPQAARGLLGDRTEKGPIVLRGLLDQEYAMLGKAIQVQLKKVGIHLEFEAGTRTDLFEQVVLPKVTGALSWQKDLFLFACPDPMYHYAFIHSVATFSGGPFTLWRSQQYDDVFRRFTQELDDGKALGLARQLDQILAAELPWIPLIQMRKGYGVRTGVDYVPTRSGMLDLRQAHWTTDTRSAR